MTNIDQQKNALWNEQGDNVHFKMPNQYKVLMVLVHHLVKPMSY